jgi:hypothetical protein
MKVQSDIFLLDYFRDAGVIPCWKDEKSLSIKRLAINFWRNSKHVHVTVM